MDLVTVIMPIYNAQPYLLDAINSIIAQTYRPLEIVIVDDCSTDNSLAIAKEAATRVDDTIQFKIAHNPVNRGAGYSRNRAVQLATGRYISFLDADDVWKPHKISTQINAMQESNAAACYSAYEVFKTSINKPIGLQGVFKKLSYNKLLKANYLGNLTGIYDAQALGKVPVSEVRKRQDWAMWLDVLKRADYAIGIQESLAYYRLSDGLSANKLKLIKYNYTIYRQHLNRTVVTSLWLMLRFFYEQFFIKAKMFKSY